MLNLSIGTLNCVLGIGNRLPRGGVQYLKTVIENRSRAGRHQWLTVSG